MLAHFFMIWDEVNCPLLFFGLVWFGFIFFYFSFLGGGGFLFVLFVVAVL